MHRIAVPFVYHPGFSIPWIDGHTFVMSKFQDLASVLVRDGVVTSFDSFVAPEPPPDEWFELVHDASYYRSFCADPPTLDPTLLRRIGFHNAPSHKQLVERTRLEVAGTVLTARLALEHGLAVSLGGGTHHAHRAWGSGFTVFNDLAVTAALLRQEGAVERVAIVDLDVHQGDGTAEIFTLEPSVFTMSMHCRDNFPLGFKAPHLGNDASDLDVALPAGTTDDEYMLALEEHLQAVWAFCPELVLFDAGVDVFEHDRLGKLNVSEHGLFRRDKFVFDECLRRGIPVAGVIGGGYDKDPMALAYRHSIVHRAAQAAQR